MVYGLAGWADEPGAMAVDRLAKLWAETQGVRMSGRKGKSSKPSACEVCTGTELVRRITTYPVRLTGPLEGKQIHVGRVALHECQTCGHLMPTPAGQAKVARNVEMGIRLFLGQLH
jgi:hypothetical protein